ncbi:MAG TPA: radical SAM protein [Usitatibacter sp.]|nr:radical SAM protein [Usitatibacter sp.]
MPTVPDPKTIPIVPTDAQAADPEGGPPAPGKSPGPAPGLSQRVGFDLGKLGRLVPVARRHIEGELRDAAYVRSRGRWDITRPRRFYGILNERCNLKCMGCDYWRLEHYVDELPSQEWIRVLKEIKDFVGPFHINFSGGEPLVKHGVFDILDFCRDNGILAGMTTNAIILKDRQAAQLVEAKLFSLNVSLDGAQEATHDLQRGVKGSYAKVLRTVALMQEHSRKTGIKVPIVIKPTVSRLNYKEMPDLVRMVAGLGVNGILFQPLGDWGTKEIQDLWINDIEGLQQVVDEVLAMKAAGLPILSAEWHIRGWVDHFRKEPIANTPDRLRRAGIMARPSSEPPVDSGDVQCWVGLTTLHIKTDGTVVNCHTLDPIGNVRNQSIRDIWHGEVGRQRRAETVKCTIGCSENCTIKRTVRQNFQGAMRLLKI